MPVSHVEVAVIGAGFGGIGAAVRLKQAGTHDFRIFERASAVGGTWRDNTYPGCACDVESQLYSFSFAPSAEWSRMYAPAPEIQRYLGDCVEKFGLRDNLLLGHDVEALRWDASRKAWHLETSQGVWSARIVVVATGPLSEPLTPHLQGLDRFRGRVFHTAKWDHDFDFRGKEVAIIGTGASAIQVVPAIQPILKKLRLFQRTPPWVVARVDRPFGAREKSAFRRWSWMIKVRRALIFAQREALGLSFRWPSLLRLLEILARKHVEAGVKSPDLIRKVTPSYRIGCKRILISNEYYPAIAQPNVEVVTTAIREVSARGVIDVDGCERAVDAIVFATGFQAVESPFARRIFGTDGRNLAATWGANPEAYLGTTVADFPNLFLILGPNTGLGHSSVVLMIEAQLDQMLRALAYMREGGYSAFTVTREAQAAFNDWLRSKSRGTVWVSGGCRSWYQNAQGGNSAIWPRSVPSFRRKARRLVTSDYRFW